MSAVTVIDDRVRDLYRQLTGSVAIISAAGPDGSVGMTVSTLVSVSLEPPLLSFCARQGSATGTAAAADGWFGVAVLAEGDTPLARSFAGGDARSRQRLLVPAAQHAACSNDRAPWGWGRVPVLAQASTVAVCEVAGMVDAGDHEIVLGRVMHSVTTSAAPLAWHDGRFATCLMLAG